MASLSSSTENDVTICTGAGDSGANITLMPLSIAKELHLTIQYLNSPITVQFAKIKSFASIFMYAIMDNAILQRIYISDEINETLIAIVDITASDVYWVLFYCLCNQQY